MCGPKAEINRALTRTASEIDIHISKVICEHVTIYGYMFPLVTVLKHLCFGTPTYVIFTKELATYGKN